MFFEGAALACPLHLREVLRFTATTPVINGLAVRNFPLVCCVFACPVVAQTCVIPERPELPEGTWTVASIRFERHPIFETTPEESIWFHRVANKYHEITTEKTLRNDLLFREGAAITALQLAENERLLRSRKYLRKATIEVECIDQTSKQVQLRVQTWDNWSLLPKISLGHSGGATKTGLGLAEDNLFGSGTQALVEYQSDAERSGYQLKLASDNLFGSFWQSSARYATNSDGESYQFVVAKPFYQLSSAQSYRLDTHKELKTISEYAYGDVWHEYQSKLQALELETGWQISGDEHFALRMLTGAMLQDQHFQPLNADFLNVPVNRNRSEVYVAWQLEQADYRELTNIYMFNRVEDLNFGWQAKLQLGRMDAAVGAYDDGWHFVVDLQKNQELSRDSWLLWHAAVERWQFDTLQRSTRWSSDLRYVHHLTERQQLIATANARFADDLERDERYTLGGDEGMRAFPLYYQTGNKAVTGSLEYRYITPWSIYQLLDVAFASFVDAGRAWDNPDAAPGADLESTLYGAGLGLRLLPNHTSRGSMISIDLTRPFSQNPELSGWRWRVIARKPF